MQYRRLGKTELKVSAVGFGGIKLTQVDDQVADQAIHRALDLGINFIDTARNYGESERKIGKVLKTRREEAIIATKSGQRDGKSMTEELETSLRDLGVEAIDLYQLHSVSSPSTWEAVTAPGGAIEAALQAKEKGLVKHVGASCHRSLDTMRKAIECGQFETIMLAYSPLDQEGVGPEILPLARQHDLGVIIMKPLAGGRISTRKPGEEDKSTAPDPVAGEAIRFALSNENVSTVIPGITCAAEVEQNAQIGDEFVPMSEQEKQRMFSAIGALQTEFPRGQFCLRCGYCQPCPNDVPIPEIFGAMSMYQHYPDEIKQMGVELYQSLEVKPDACVECHECVEKCPAGIDIPERLKEAAEILERGRR